jgi:hypothetical protein
MRAQRRGDYGIDAPYVPIGLVAGAIVGLAFGVVGLTSKLHWLAGIGFANAVLLKLSALKFIWTTRRGKFEVWAELHGREQALAEIARAQARWNRNAYGLPIYCRLPAVSCRTARYERRTSASGMAFLVRRSPRGHQSGDSAAAEVTSIETASVFDPVTRTE